MLMNQISAFVNPDLNNSSHNKDIASNRIALLLGIFTIVVAIAVQRFGPTAVVMTVLLDIFTGMFALPVMIYCSNSDLRSYVLESIRTKLCMYF